MHLAIENGAIQMTISPTTLRRAITLPLSVLYGLSNAISAGEVLIKRLLVDSRKDR